MMCFPLRRSIVLLNVTTAWATVGATSTISTQDTLWTATFEGDDFEFGFSGAQTTDGRFIFTCETYSRNDDGGAVNFRIQRRQTPVWSIDLTGL